MSRFENNEQVQKLLPDAKRSGGQGWLRVNCPFCLTKLAKVDHKRALAINSYSGGWYCLRCGTSGRLRNPPDEFGASQQERTQTTAIEPPEYFTELWTGDGKFAECLEPAREYLRSRKLPTRLWDDARIGACPTGRYGGRVVVPILPVTGEYDNWLGWVARVWVPKAERTYMYPRGMLRGQILYNHAALLEKTDEPAIVVEGVFDSLALWPQAVAVLGKPSDPQVDAMLASPRPIAVVLDGDAWEQGEALATHLRLEGHVAGSVRLPPKVDPDEVDPSWLREEARRCLA